jgi:outer membrane lipoprotein SlyB
MDEQNIRNQSKTQPSSWIFTMSIEHKNAVGTFPSFQEIESALRQLKATGFHMNNVSVVAEHLNSASDTLGRSTDATIQSEDEFTWGSTVERIEHGAVDAGAIGSVVGGVVAGLTTLAFSAFSGAIVLVGITAGAFYGAVSGSILGGGIGFDITEKQAKYYSDLLAQGHYLTIVKGTDDEISQAESVLKNINIRDWMIFNTL